MTLISQSNSIVEILTPESVSKSDLGSDIDNLTHIMSQPPLAPFSESTMIFLKAFSKKLTKQQAPELVALGFWLRESQVKRWHQAYVNSSEAHVLRQSLGTVLHFTPANVDTMFVYSWVCALIMGNVSVVRISGQSSVIKSQLIKIINELYSCQEYVEISSRNCFIYYPHNAEVTASLSTSADARVIWGGDEAVMHIRSINAKPRTRDISFSDRYSVTVIDATKLNTQQDVEQLAQLLWKDAAPYGQMACSSPKAIYWLGPDRNQKALFEALNNCSQVEDRHINQKTNHLISTQLSQAHGMAKEMLYSDAITIVSVVELPEQLFSWHTGEGFFYFKVLDSLQQLAENLSERCQTLSYWGMDKQVLIKHLCCGPITPIDRVVPVGQSLDFDSVWDGYDLLQQLSRNVTIR